MTRLSYAPLLGMHALLGQVEEDMSAESRPRRNCESVVQLRRTRRHVLEPFATSRPGHWKAHAAILDHEPDMPIVPSERHGCVVRPRVTQTVADALAGNIQQVCSLIRRHEVGGRRVHP